MLNFILTAFKSSHQVKWHFFTNVADPDLSLPHLIVPLVFQIELCQTGISLA